MSSLACIACKIGRQTDLQITVASNARCFRNMFAAEYIQASNVVQINCISISRRDAERGLLASSQNRDSKILVMKSLHFSRWMALAACSQNWVVCI
ncbi:uncharacterized protein MYCFIDRAFT_208928 [Pseudocercospora fijiensis CIRAD86]|uniref:Uncharacterized protein n=1 Tax=Pseudocercospora fijiensis (strain CIRAD86) TaxID=383855 RepID=M2YKN6_PSEFD|nr:uncharacterized protein MYCFIDRAFT_208928 [Pseudocercospora fijiensis CIRAD86]EME78280.1 hypothetical protein MYCFIDRAFT_208928 [Pseudocercospora fijiensis CIRAD86]